MRFYPDSVIGMTTSTTTNRRVSEPPHLRPQNELEATLLPTASPLEALSEDNDNLLELPVATPTMVTLPSATSRPANARTRRANAELSRHSWHPCTPTSAANSVIQDATVLPVYPQADGVKYGDDAKRRLEFAQQQGRQASYAERVNVMKNNDKVHAYNNQMELDVNRANEVARIEHHRERRLTSPALVARAASPTPPTRASGPGLQRRNTTEPARRPRPQLQPYFTQSQRGSGYQVKEYKVEEYDGGYSYDISEYKSDYD